MLRSSGRVTVADLAESLNVAEATVRRDLDCLESDGVLKRYHGGAYLQVGSSYEPPFAVREMANIEAKQAIARTVADQINDGDTVILDGGSTGLAIAEAVAQRAITVCPLSLRIAWALAKSQTVKLLLPSGTVRSREFSLVGAEITEYLHRHRFDKYIATASGITPKAGLTEWNPDDAVVKQVAIDTAEVTIAAVDASKYAQICFVNVCSISTPDTIVIDNRLPEAAAETIRAAGGKITICPEDLERRNGSKQNPR